MKKFFFTLLFLFITIFTHNLYSQQQIPDNTSGRLWGLCKVWGYMKYYHPKICQINWDSLVHEKIPMVLNAGSNAEYNTILWQMVQDLGQISIAQATVPGSTDSNLNLDTLWMNSEIFSPQLQAFLDTFSSRAGRNDAISNCYTSIYELINTPTILSPINYNEAATRLTLAFKYWNTYNYFSPYRHLIDQDWDTTLMNILPELTNNIGRLAFDLAMEKMNAKTDDGHGGYRGVFSYFRTEKALGIKIERIQNKAVITKVYPGVTNVAVGDIILEVNGQPIDQITDSYRKYLASSNDAWYYILAYRNIIRGPEFSEQTVNLKLQNAQQEYSTILNRNLNGQTWHNWSREDAKPEWTILCNNYGYVNMNKLEPENVAAMYQALKDQPAIIFDVRSYLKTSIWDLAKYFMPEPATSAQFWSQTATSPGRFNFFNDQDNVAPFNNPNFYPGKIYFLINENAISASEYFVQYMQHAPDATTVGSQSAGADGNVIAVSLTVNTIYRFTGLGISYIDGYQCQRNGIRVDNIVTPTVQGIRDGHDEVLESITNCVTPLHIANKGIDQLEVMPNPASALLNIRFSATGNTIVQLTISDILGSVKLSQQKRTEAGKNNWQLPVNDLVPGIYFLKINTSDGRNHTLKFIKE